MRVFQSNSEHSECVKFEKFEEFERQVLFDLKRDDQNDHLAKIEFTSKLLLSCSSEVIDREVEMEVKILNEEQRVKLFRRDRWEKNVRSLGFKFNDFKLKSNLNWLT